MLDRYAALADVAAAITALPSQRTRFVGVDGCGGAGKTSFAAALADRVPDSAVVHVDDLQGAGVPEWDWDRFDHDIVGPLLAGRVARYAVVCWGEVEPREHRSVRPGGVVIVEGVSATRSEANVPWDVTVWVDTPEHVRRRRTLLRDGTALLTVWREEWIPREEAYVARERPAERADFVVSGTSLP